MNAYIRSLERDTEQENARRAAVAETARAAEVDAARQRLKPLVDRLARVLASIPGDVQREGLSLTTLSTMLRGRWRGQCHPGDLGDALRKLGFKRRRGWNNDVGFRALWFPERED